MVLTEIYKRFSLFHINNLTFLSIFPWVVSSLLHYTYIFFHSAWHYKMWYKLHCVHIFRLTLCYNFGQPGLWDACFVKWFNLSRSELWYLALFCYHFVTIVTNCERLFWTALFSTALSLLYAYFLFSLFFSYLMIISI